MRARIKVALGAAAAGGVYLLVYGMLMDPSVPALDVNAEIAFDFSSRHTGVDFYHVGYTLECRNVTLLNYVFLPAHRAYRCVVPARTNSVWYQHFPVRRHPKVPNQSSQATPAPRLDIGRSR